MDFLLEFETIMAKSSTIALATSVDNSPNVRIVVFYHDNRDNKILYFPTLKDSKKTVEFSQNEKVSFTTIPGETNGVVRVCNARVQKSKKTVDEIKDGIINEAPGFANMVANSRSMMEIYEIHFSEAVVTVGNVNTSKITL